MTIRKEQREKIKKQLLREIELKKGIISVSDFAEQFTVTRATIYRYLSEMEKLGIIEKKKLNDKQNQYLLVDTVDFSKTYKIDKQLKEDEVWNKDIKPLLNNIGNIPYTVANYAFTEIFNNAIEHSEGTRIDVIVKMNAYNLQFFIHDNGIGIFSKIQNALGLAEKNYAILELAKGKFTTDPKSHTGEGIFFTSKIADSFAIISDELHFLGSSYQDKTSEYLFTRPQKKFKGTWVSIQIELDRTVSYSDVVNAYTEYPEDYGFNKTVVPVRLLEYSEDRPQFISRSQAKRLLSRFEKFETIMLDFYGVDEIGQGFADEIFRVFQNQHPFVKLVPIHVNTKVEQMIKHVRANDIG